MTKQDLKNKLQQIKERLKLDKKYERIQALTKAMENADFWQDHVSAAKKTKELAELEKETSSIKELESLIMQGKQDEVIKKMKQIEDKLFLSGPYDRNDAVVSIHAGQGGIEAMDWVEMLFRMYSRYATNKNYQWEIIEWIAGEEAGAKSITFTVSGLYAYGRFKFEAGVHRLVRQSPFNADHLRQTSFALLEVLPLGEETEGIKIKEEDLEWEFFRSSGHGGQNVNKVSTAVRLRHKPSGIIVRSQTERSQRKNRDLALKLLKAKLWEKQEIEAKEKEKQLKGAYVKPGWGSQIRSYVLHPYHLVKDLRTNYQTENTNSVLDGNLDAFIEAELRQLSKLESMI